MKNMKTAVPVTASLCIVLTATVGGCESSAGTAGLVGVGTAALAGGIAKAAGANDTQAALIGVGAGAIAGGITYAVVEYQKREAAERDRQVAVAAAQQRQAELSKGEQTVIKNEKAKMAVVVGETADSQLVMIVDPATNQPVDNSVYTVKKSQIQNLPSLAGVQQKQGASGEWSSEPAKPAAKTPAPSASEPSSTPAQTSPSSDPSVAPIGSPGAVNPENVRFGTLGSEKVVFRL